MTLTNKMKLGTQVGLGPGHIVLTQLPLPKGARPQISVHVCCGQTVLNSATAEHLSRYTSGQTYRHAHRNISHPYRGEVNVIF